MDASDQRIPAGLLSTCSDCEQPQRKIHLREFGDSRLCAGCFEHMVHTAEEAKEAMLLQLREPERVCSNCRAMVDPSVCSPWCSVLELGDDRASLCGNFQLLAQTGPFHESALVEDPKAVVGPLHLWSIVCADLESTLGPTHVSWLRNTRPVAFEGRVLHVNVSDEYTRSWIVYRLNPAITRALEMNGFPDVSVEFRTGPVEGEPSHMPAPEGRRTETLALKPAPSAEVSGFATPPSASASGFNPAFSFEQFVIGPGNRLAQAGALSVAEGASTYNPLFLHGAVGVGKTHLLQAIGLRCAQRGRNALYISSETFTNELIAAIRAGNTAEFRQRYRQIEILLVDDIHFIVGKESTQEEFFHTFNWLYDSGKQIVLSSDRAPHEMRILNERLRSRFSWGLMADMQPPEFETRLEILRRKVRFRGRQVEDEVLVYLARQSGQNVRELEGMLNKLLAMSDVHGLELTVDLAATLTAERARQHQVGAEDVIRAVCGYFHVAAGALSGKQRSRNVSTPRHIAMYLMREDARLSLSHIGDLLGGRDHSTVIYGCDRIAKAMKSGGPLRHDIEGVRTLLVGA